MTGALDEEVKGRGDNKSLGVEQVYNRVWTRVRWVSLGVLGGVQVKRFGLWGLWGFWGRGFGVRGFGALLLLCLYMILYI